MRRRILIIDDLPKQRAFLVDALRSRYGVLGVATVQEACEQAETGEHDAMVISRRAWTSAGRFVGELQRRTRAPIIVTIETGWGVEEVTELLGMGAADCVDAPLSVERIVYVIERALRHRELEVQNRRLRKSLNEAQGARTLVGSSPAIQSIRETIRRVAATRAPVIVTGESGTGKEIVAREIHRLSDRGDERFVVINCAALPGELLSNELFGHEKTTAQGDVRVTPGKLETSNRGTLVLDEIGDMSAAVQAALLGVIQDGEVNRVGGSAPIHADVRFIATTSRSLETEIQKGKFRRDLFYRLNVVPVDIAPLRERREDIPVLVQHFIEVLGRLDGKPPVRLTEGAMHSLCRAEWRGNVRELVNMVERMMILASGRTLDESYFETNGIGNDGLVNMEKTFRDGSIRAMEKLMIMHRLGDHSQNRTHTAKTLQISVRTLRNKLREYREKQREPVLP